MSNFIKKAFNKVPKKVQMDAGTCKALCKEAGIEYLEGYEGRIYEVLVTDQTPDRMGDVIAAAGVDLKNYKKNPVILFSHDSKSVPVGSSIKTWYDSVTESVKSYALFYDSRVDTTGKSDQIFRFVSAGALKGASIGFNPIEMYSPNNPDERKTLGIGQYGIYFKKCEMLEYSICTIGCNPNAGVKSEVLTEDDLLVLKSLETKEEDLHFVTIERALTQSENRLAEITEELKSANLKLADLYSKVDALTTMPIYDKEEKDNKDTAITAEDFESIYKNIFKGN